MQGPPCGSIARVTAVAFVRKPTASLALCELTHLERVPIDVARADAQHAAYAAALGELGAHIEWLPPLANHPDAVFVEDTAMVLPELAIIARPGAESRQGEVLSVANALSRHRGLAWIRAPATLDGGDVLAIGRTIFVGLSTRTNSEGVAAMREIVEPHHYEVVPVRIRRSLHLKSACTYVPPVIVVANPAWIDPAIFGGMNVIATHDAEPAAACTLTFGGSTLVQASAPRTAERLRNAGVNTRPIDVSELQKAEAGLTCMSLIVPGTIPAY
jgi:dimethylargininase